MLSRMRRFNIGVALITALPLALFIGAHKANGWVDFAVAAVLVAILVGVPQGYVVSRFLAASRGWWHVVALLPVLMLPALGTALVATITVETMPHGYWSRGHWERMPDPRVYFSALIGPQCDEKGRVVGRMYARREDGPLYHEQAGVWDPIDDVRPGYESALSGSRCLKPSEFVAPEEPSGVISHVGFVTSLHHCEFQTHYILRDNGSIWQSRITPPHCANWDVEMQLLATGLLSVILSGCAWLVVVLRLPILGAFAWVAVALGQRSRPS
jgi:hypothetical protein